MRVPDPDRRNLLEGKVCLITGGGGSLGRATARIFLKEGARVVLADRATAALTAAQGALDDVNVSVVSGDATVEADVVRTMDAVIDRHDRLDVLVANAGTPAAAAPVTEFDVDEFDRTLAVHVRGVFLACKHGLRVLGDGGSVVIVSGVAGLRAEAGISVYAAAEHAQVGLMRSVAKEAAVRGIRVNTIHPGPVANDFQAGIEERLTPVLGTDATAFFDRQIPLGRHAHPEEIARSVLYLASAQSSFTTGSTLVVDGGMSA
jgi:NAD(P)-dependent dehydrogenase (short-subunit alcohol dehydrogenase family)